HLELRPDRRQRMTTLDLGLDLADDLGEHGDDAVVVATGSPLGARACAVLTRACAVLTRACAVRALGSSSHGLLLGPIGHACAPGPRLRRTRGGATDEQQPWLETSPEAQAGPADLHEIDASDVF